MDDFEKALPYDPNKPKVGPAAKTYPLGITHPFDRYANPSNPGNVPPSSFYYNNKKPKLTKQKVSKQEKTEQYYSQERLDSIRSEHLNSAKPIEGDIEDMDERFPKFKNKNHRKKTELDKQVPRFKEDKVRDCIPF